jgi:hypothetical protein
VDESEGKYFISNDSNPYQVNVFSITQSDHTPNTVLIKGKKDRRIKDLIESYQDGSVYYESMSLKNIFYEIIRLYLM